MSKKPIVHIEIPTADRHASAKFYGELFGWDMQDEPSMEYMMFQSGSVDGSFSPMGDYEDMNTSIEPGDVLLYIESDDIEADLERIEAQGGESVSPKTEIPNIGWFAYFKDPDGNQLALYTARDMEGGDAA